MSVLGCLLLLVIGAICGLIAEAIVGFRPGGLLVSAFIGFVGAVLGSWIARETGLPGILPLRVETETIDIVWAVIGAILVVLVLAFVRRAVFRRLVP